MRKVISSVVLLILILCGCGQAEGTITRENIEAVETDAVGEELKAQEEREGEPLGEEVREQDEFLEQSDAQEWDEEQECAEYDWQGILTLSESILPEKEALVSALQENVEVLGWAEGDVGPDGQEDIAVVFQYPVDGCFERKIAVFTKKNAQYECMAFHETLVPNSVSGGTFGDPYNGICIDEENGNLCFSVYGGSAWRWGIDISFALEDGKLVQREYVDRTHSTFAGDVITRRHSFEKQNTECYAYWFDEDGEHEKLLYRYNWAEEVEAPEFLEVESIFCIQNVAAFDIPLPDLEISYESVQAREQKADFDASIILDEAMASFDPDMQKVMYDTDSIFLDNISLYLGYEIPAYYYEDEAGYQLYYEGAEYDEETGWIHRIGDSWNKER